MNGRGLACIVALLGLAAACAGPQETVHTFDGLAMGSTYTVKVAAEELPPDRQEAIRAAIEAVLEEIDLQMSTWRSDSELSRFNDFAETTPFEVSPGLIYVLDVARQVSEQSGGVFDVTVGPLAEAWGFGKAERPEQPLSDEEIARLRESVGYEKLEIDPAAGTLRKTHPDLRIDVGSLAPGYGSDRIGEALEKLGYGNYMVELGGEVRAAGRKLDGSPWKIGIERPDTAARTVHRSVSLEDESLSTSGDYRDYFEKDGVRYSHTLDPRTGKPITHNLASVSVITKECVWADAYATALSVLGPEEGYAWAVEHDLPALFLVREEPGRFRETATPAFERRFGKAAPAPERRQ